MDSGLRRNDGGSVTGFGWRNAIRIPDFAGMTGGGAGMTGGGNDGGSVTGFGWRNAIQIPAFAGMTGVGAGMGERRGNDEEGGNTGA